MPDIVGFPAEVSKADAEQLQLYREILEKGIEFRRSARQSTWKRSEDQYEGSHTPAGASEDRTADLIVINVSFSTVNTIMPYITAEEPSFLVKPHSADATVKNARLQQALLNRIWRSQATGSQRSTEDAAVDFLIYGDGYLKATYEIVEQQRDLDEFVEVVELFVDRVDPWDVWIDPYSDGIHNARWVAQRIITTRYEMEQDDRYKNVDLDPLVKGSIEMIEEKDRGIRESTMGDESQQWIILFEFYDVVRREMWVFSDVGHDLPLRKVTGILPTIVQLANYRLPRSPYHMGELEQIWSVQQELNKTRSQLITHRRRNVSKILIREDVIGEETKQALQSPIVNELVPIKGDLPLDAVTHALQLPPLPPEAYASADQALRDIYEISGVNEYLRGATPEIRRTATEASIIEGASNVKTRAKLSAIERAVRGIGTFILEIAKATFPETEVDEMAMFLTGSEAEAIARIDAGEEADELTAAGDLQGAREAFELGAQSDVTLTPSEEIFEGRYEVEVEQGSTELRNPIFREQKFREMAVELVNMSPVLQQSGITVNLRKALERWFEAAGIADIEGMFDAAGGLPPEIMAQLQGGQQGAPNGAGLVPSPGQPNIDAAQPPIAALTAGNTGQNPPA